MKQLWFGAALLAALLVGSLCLGNYLGKVNEQPVRDLDRAGEAALEEEWGRALAHTARAKKQWQSHRDLAAALLSHGPLEQIDTGFAQLDAFAAARDPVQFSAACATLSQSLQSLHQSHSFHWWNLL